MYTRTGPLLILDFLTKLPEKIFIHTKRIKIIMPEREIYPSLIWIKALSGVVLIQHNLEFF